MTALESITGSKLLTGLPRESGSAWMGANVSTMVGHILMGRDEEQPESEEAWRILRAGSVRVADPYRVIAVDLSHSQSEKRWQPPTPVEVAPGGQLSRSLDTAALQPREHAPKGSLPLHHDPGVPQWVDDHR